MLGNGRIPLHNAYISKIWNLAGNSGFYVKRMRHTQKDIERRMKKTLMQNKNLKKQFDMASEILSHEPNQYHIKAKEMKETSRSSTIRNKTVAYLIKNELQKLIESGELGEEIQALNLTFTKATLSSHNKCQIFWEPYLSAKDFEVADMLNRLSAKFRHLLMTNLIMNNVPELQFYMDQQSYRIAVVDEILRNENLDIGKEPETVPAASCVEDSSNSKNDQAYGLDRDGMLKRLNDIKKKSSPQKS